MKRFRLTIVLMIIALFLSNCSTVLNTTTQDVEIKTVPANAKITIDGKKFGTTPQVVNIDRGSNHVVKLDLDGFEPYETQLTKKISIWFWGNALNGFLPGMLIDMFTGSMYNLLPEGISVELQAAKPEPQKKSR
ncbi:MAG: PEGA domain-containing protein [Ignavibacteria bacterium]|nr:PEGA domain-containing protein [Ignavibacteria bacterium]